MKAKTKGVKNSGTVSKGYRLRPATHNMIKKMQTRLSSTQEKIISSALKLYSEYIKENNFNKI
jgi:hypothetical protein